MRRVVLQALQDGPEAPGGLYGDTSGFRERDMAAGWRATKSLPIGFQA